MTQREILLFHKGRAHAKILGGDMLEDNIKEVKLHQLPIFKFEELATATENFKLSNKLGQGGFGPVYRVKLSVFSQLRGLQNDIWTLAS